MISAKHRIIYCSLSIAAKSFHRNTMLHAPFFRAIQFLMVHSPTRPRLNLICFGNDCTDLERICDITCQAALQLFLCNPQSYQRPITLKTAQFNPMINEPKICFGDFILKIIKRFGNFTYIKHIANRIVEVTVKQSNIQFRLKK